MKKAFCLQKQPICLYNNSCNYIKASLSNLEKNDKCRHYEWKYIIGILVLRASSIVYNFTSRLNIIYIFKYFNVHALLFLMRLEQITSDAHNLYSMQYKNLTAPSPNNLCINKIFKTTLHVLINWYIHAINHKP